MTDLLAHPSWVEANQRFLVAEFARVRSRLATGETTDASLEAELAEARAALPAAAALDLVASTFVLTAFERDLLVLCAGAEMDARIAQALERGGRASAVTFGLALGALEAPHWSALTPSGPLRRWKLIELEPGPSLTSSSLRIDERILHFLAGINVLDARLRPVLRAIPTPAFTAPSQAALAESLAAQWRMAKDAPLLIHLHGDDTHGQEDVAALVSAGVGLRLMALRAEDIPSAPSDLDVFATLWERESALLGTALLVHADKVQPPVTMLADRVSPLLVASREAHRWNRPALAHDVHKPEPTEQALLWKKALGAAGEALNGSVEGAAGQLRLSAQGILAASVAVECRLAVGAPPATAFRETCATSSRRALGGLARRIASQMCWEDLVLPEHQLATLKQIAVHVRQRARVHEEWGFGQRSNRGLGVSALFAGESGTGKTLAAEVIARELGLDLYHVDLSSVVSKYIGETEKNLRAVFDAAEEGGAILLFDEADALFGKRSDVKDSHDRYANVEVSYLLQRMEAYRGLAILTTNLKSALDQAFHRRLRFVVQFPFPDEHYRAAIWKRVFPASTPTDGLDFGKLARLHVAGGTIRNIALNAAFLAAEASEAVAMRHLYRAAHAESAKLERPLGGNETRGWL